MQFNKLYIYPILAYTGIIFFPWIKTVPFIKYFTVSAFDITIIFYFIIYAVTLIKLINNVKIDSLTFSILSIIIFLMWGAFSLIGGADIKSTKFLETHLLLIILLVSPIIINFTNDNIKLLISFFLTAYFFCACATIIYTLLGLNTGKSLYFFEMGYNTIGRLSTMAIVMIWNFKFGGKLNILKIVLFAIPFYLVIMSGSRMAFLSFILITMILFFNERGKILFLAPIIILISIIVFVDDINALNTFHRFNVFIDQYQYGYGNIGDRLALYKEGFQLIQENSMFGLGLNAFNAHSMYFRHPHNIFLEIMIEAGLVGLIIFLGILFFIIKGTYEKYFKIIFYLFIVALLNAQTGGDIVDNKILFLFMGILISNRIPQFNNYNISNIADKDILYAE